MGLFARYLATTLALWVVTFLPLDVAVTGGDSGSTWSRVLVFLGVGAVMTLVNLVVKPIVKFVTAPIRLLTLGLFSLVINWGMLVLASWITSKFSFGSLEIGGFWKTLGAAVVISIVVWFVGLLIPKRKKDD
jgi:putative membrane protein